MTSHAKEQEAPRHLLRVVIGEQMKRDLQAVAAENERSLSQEARLALCRHLADDAPQTRGDEAA